MKIAFVTPAYYPALIGASLYCQSLAKQLKKSGIEVSVYVNAPPGFKKEEEIDGVAVKRFYPKIFGRYYISSGMLSSVLKDEHDIIHSHHYGYYPATSGLVVSKIRRIPHVFGPYFHPPVYGIRRMAYFSAYHISQGLPLLRLSDSVLPHTEYEKHLLIKYGASADKMKILPNIVDTKRFKKGKHKENMVLFTSSLIAEKGANVALEIAERISQERNDVKFVFIGNIPDGEIKKRAARLRKRKNFIFLQNLPLTELVRWYQRALVFIMPSRYEAFARVIAEAEACGCAIVSTNVGGIPEVVNDGKTGHLVDYGNWKEMKEKVEYLLDNPGEAKKLGTRGEKYVRNNFDIEIVVDKLAKIYRGLL